VARRPAVVLTMATEAGLGDGAPSHRVAILRRRKLERKLVHRHETRHLQFLNRTMRAKTKTETGRRTTLPKTA